MQFAASIVALSAGQNVNHCAAIIEANNLDEAIGKANRMAEISYRSSDGWFRRHVVVEPSGPIEPEAAQRFFPPK